MNQAHLRPQRSAYFEDVVSVAKELDYSICDLQNAEEVTQVGMAIEIAYQGWERNQEQEHFDSEKECVAAYLGGALDQVRSERGGE